MRDLNSNVDGHTFKSDDYLELTLFDKDALRDEFLGTVKVPMRGFKFNKYITETVYVTGKAGMDRVPSSIDVAYYVETPRHPVCLSPSPFPLPLFPCLISVSDATSTTGSQKVDICEPDAQTDQQEKQVLIFFGAFLASTFVIMILGWLFGYGFFLALAQLGGCVFVIWKKVLQNLDAKDIDLAKKCHDWD